MSGNLLEGTLPEKRENVFIMKIFQAVGLEKLVRGKWLTAEMWGGYIDAHYPMRDGITTVCGNTHRKERLGGNENY